MNTKFTLFSAILAPILFGSVPTCVRYLPANTATIGLVRILSAVFVVSLFLYLRKKRCRPSLKELPVLVSIGLLFGLHWLTYFLAIKLSSASLGALSFSTYGFQLIIVGSFFGLHKITRIDILSLILASIGSFLILPEFSFENEKTLGVLCGIGSAFLYSLLPVLHQRNAQIDQSLRTWGQLTFALPVFLFLLPQTEWNMELHDWLVLLYLGPVVTVVGHSLWIHASTHLSTAISSLINYLYLPSSLVIAWLVLGEEITLWMWIGAISIISGTLLSLWYRFRSHSILA